jgi:hypothetical protein
VFFSARIPQIRLPVEQTCRAHKMKVECHRHADIMSILTCGHYDIEPLNRSVSISLPRHMAKANFSSEYVKLRAGQCVMVLNSKKSNNMRGGVATLCHV